MKDCDRIESARAMQELKRDQVGTGCRSNSGERW